jgi:hypothetical protein
MWDELDSYETIGWECYGTPLLRAIKRGRTEAVKFLLERGASITKRGHNGQTALEMVRSDEKEVVAWEIMELVETAVERERKGNGEGAER